MFSSFSACGSKKEIPSSFNLNFSAEKEDSFNLFDDQDEFVFNNQDVLSQEEIALDGFIAIVDSEIEYTDDSENIISDPDLIIDDDVDDEEIEVYTENCEPPAPNVCAETCCPNNHECVCEEKGGFCLQSGAKMCNCEDKAWCYPYQDCIQNESCRKLSMFCMPSGSEECPSADKCYCNPTFICTNAQPACCPLDTPVPCVDYCCPADNECLTDIKDCKPSNWDYCDKWQIKCPPGMECMEEQSGCKNDGETECEYGVVCAVNNFCVEQGKGENGSGCCPGNNPIACDNYCCPSGTHCDAGCSGCVINGYKCCLDGQTSCLNDEICWEDGTSTSCLPSGSQDCGNYWCDPGYVCSNGPQKCCPASVPQTCGDKCCHSYETCYQNTEFYNNYEWLDFGFCVDEQGGEEYCGNSLKCEAGKNCCGFWQCYPEGGECCGKYSDGSYCKIGYECCGNGCKPQGTKCSHKDNYWFYCDIGLKPCDDKCMPATKSYHCCGSDCGGKGGEGLYCPKDYYCWYDECLPKDKVDEQGACCKVELIPGTNEWKCADIPGTIPTTLAEPSKPLKPFGEW